MRRVPLFLRAAVVCSSLTLLLGFVAMKAGALSGRANESSPQTNTVMMPSPKFAPVDINARELVTSAGKSSVKVPADAKAAASSATPFHAFSSKSAVPVVKMEQLEKAISEIEPLKNVPESHEKAAPRTPLLMPSTKRAEVFESQFPARPPARTPDAPPVTFPSTKSMAPAINFSPPPAPPSKAIAPQTTKGKGY